MKINNKINCAVLGATGIVGQAFLRLLENHPLFRVVMVSGSDARSGKKYSDTVKWHLPGNIPLTSGSLHIEPLSVKGILSKKTELVFSALPSDIAAETEPELRDSGLSVFSNAGAMRQKKDVPVVIPEVNPEAMNMVFDQGYPDRGFIVTNGNCSTIGLATVLAPLRKFGIRKVWVSTYQAVSGAGYPGTSAMDIIGDIIPYISEEEDKLEREFNKICGTDISVYASCARVPVKFGHLESVWVEFDENPEKEEIIEEWGNFKQKYPLFTCSEKPVVYTPDRDFPKPSDCFYGDPPGMEVYTGRLRQKQGLTGFNLVVNNIIKGAAGGSVQNAELFYKVLRGRPE